MRDSSVNAIASIKLQQSSGIVWKEGWQLVVTLSVERERVVSCVV
jgi:hypothetical protein